jgi:hypothetical protein
LSKAKHFESSLRNIAATLLSYLAANIADREGSYYSVITRSSVSLGYVASLMTFLKMHFPEHHNTIAEDLYLPSYIPNLVWRGLGKQLDHFAKFIEYSEQQVKVCRETFLEHLSLSKSIELLDLAFQRSSLDSIIYFVRFWEGCSCQKCLEYRDRLRSRIFSPALKPDIIQAIKSSGIQQVTTFIKYAHRSGADIGPVLMPDLSTQSVVDSVLSRTVGIQPNQASAILDDLQQAGDIGQIMANKFRAELLGPGQDTFLSLRNNADIRDTVAFLKRSIDSAQQKNNFEILARLKEVRYFENWALQSLNNASAQKAGQHMHSIQTGFITRLSVVFKYLQKADPELNERLVSICNENINALINVLTREHIDIVSLLLSTLKDLGNCAGGLFNRVISRLSEDDSMEALCQNSFVKDVSYLKSFLAFTKGYVPSLYAGMLSLMETRYVNAFYDACARSTPHQLVGLLTFQDKQYKGAILDSVSILRSFQGKRKDIFYDKFNRTPANHKDSLIRYVAKKSIKIELNLEET